MLTSLAPKFQENHDSTMLTSNDKALRIIQDLRTIMTTVKPNGTCNILNDTTQAQEQKSYNDDEMQHGNAMPCVRVVVFLYSTELCCRRRR